jgi:metal-dependent amidase/aminoacylase/carboxypeptidase family protein
MPVINRIAAMSDEITAWRHDFHEHPELQYDVHRTAGIVAEKLRAFGCDRASDARVSSGLFAGEKAVPAR